MCARTGIYLFPESVCTPRGSTCILFKTKCFALNACTCRTFHSVTGNDGMVLLTLMPGGLPRGGSGGGGGMGTAGID